MKLTSVERWERLYMQSPLDTMPVVLFDNLVSAKLIDRTYLESEADATLLLEKLLKSYQTFKADSVSLNYSMSEINQVLGGESKVTHPNTSRSIVAYPAQALEDVAALPELALETLPVTLRLRQAIEHFLNEAHGEVPVRLHFRGPFSMVAGLIESEKILRGMRRDPEGLHAALAYTTQLATQLVECFSDLAPIIYNISDPVASGSLISHKQYEAFAFPYTQQLVETLHQQNQRVHLHICGNTERALPLIQQTGVDAFSMDQVVDVAKAFEMTDHQLLLMGNVDPVKFFLEGTPEEIKQEVERIAQAAKDAKGTLILAPGCDLPYDTPIEQIQAFMEAARACL